MEEPQKEEKIQKAGKKKKAVETTDDSGSDLPWDA